MLLLYCFWTELWYFNLAYCSIPSLVPCSSDYAFLPVEKQNKKDGPQVALQSEYLGRRQDPVLSTWPALARITIDTSNAMWLKRRRILQSVAAIDFPPQRNSCVFDWDACAESDLRCLGCYCNSLEIIILFFYDALTQSCFFILI